MKKLIAMLLALTCVFGLVACGGNANNEESTPETEAQTQPVETEPVETEPETDPDETESAATETNGAVDVMSKIWAAVAEDSKFFAMGGDMNHMTDSAPGFYSLTDEGLTATLLVPAEQISNIDEAASLMHGMLANNFTFGTYHVTGDVNAFVDAMHAAIAGNQWMCGFPDKMLIAVVDGQYVIAGYGINDAVNPFETALTATYPEAEIKYNEAIAG